MRHPARSPRFQRNALSAAVLGALASLAQALPQDGNVVAGSGSIDQSGSNMTINQGTQKLIVDWQSFGIASGESVQFVQPGSDAVALNRVLGNNSSEIFGSLSANGQVFLTNPNGILFGATAQVDVGGLVASTLNISNEDFLNGHYVFSGADGGQISNQGTLQARDGGVIALLAPEVRNQGLILAREGAVALGAGTRITLDFANGLRLEVEESALNAVIENHHAVRADGGLIILSASAQQALLGGMINNTGVLEAGSVSGEGGVIRLSAGFQSLGGTLNASGRSGGEIDIRGNNINQFGRISANGTAGSGGVITLEAANIVQPDSAQLSATGRSTGGSIRVQGRESLMSSATLTVAGRQRGGSIDMLGDDIKLAAATLDASGRRGGGNIHIGGDYQGVGERQRASSVWINPFTTLNASAGRRGNGGTVVLWSDGSTAFGGTALARGGRRGGDGGLIEVSGAQALQFAGMGDASARRGVDGTLLLDPKNILITDTPLSTLQVIPLLDPAPTPGDNHGQGQTEELANGNIVQVSMLDDFGGTDAGAVYTYRQSDGALLSMLTGDSAGDRIGSNGVTELSNANFVIASPEWDNGAAVDAGAATWGSATAGVSGVVSASNSIVGDSSGDAVANNGVISLGNGNYVVSSIFWNNDGAEQAGAVTWGNGATGTSGVVSADNSLVGSSEFDRVGSFGITVLPSGNYVVNSLFWDNGAATDAGAVTWGSGTGGVSGEISAANSLVGTQTNDLVGLSGVTVLANGNYVVGSSVWDNGGATDAGAATWGSGTSGVSGSISASNSIIGTQAFDEVSSRGIFALTNGNYVVASPNWDNGAAQNAGAATWGDGDGGTVGAVSAGNSLVGTQAGDQVSAFGITPLVNGNYVVSSPNWDNGVIADAGAVTWGDGDSGITGAVSVANSLVGDAAGDLVGNGEILALGNGNYVVSSLNWSNGGVSAAGAATFGDGDSGISGVVSESNSLVGDSLNDHVGSDLVELANGNYVVVSPLWRNGDAIAAGAVTWGSGSSGVSGVVSASNSIVGSSSGDFVGFDGVTTLSNGNYVVLSSSWDNGAATDAGAATWGSGSGGSAGVISAANSLVGTQAFDRVGEGGALEVGDSNYVVRSTFWDNGSIEDAGAVTWGDGDSGVRGAVGAGNSLVGDTDFDLVGSHGVTVLTNGNYVVASANWNNGIIESAGAATWGNGNTGIAGVVSAGNSLVGNTEFDRVGSGGVTALAEGDYVVGSPQWDRALIMDAGAATLADGDTGLTGIVSSGNSLVGVTAFDQVGAFASVTALSTGDALVRSPLYNNNTGRVDILRLGDGGNFPLVGDLRFDDHAGENITLHPDQVTAILGTGTNLTLQASNDIRVEAPIIVSNPNGDGGDFTLQAGRSVFLNDGITTDNGDLTVIANERYSNGVIAAHRDPGAAVINLGEDVALNAGRGDVRLIMQSENNAGTERIVFGNNTTASGERVTILNLAEDGVIRFQDGSVVTATGRGIPLIVGATDNGRIETLDGAAHVQTPNGFWLAFERQDGRFNFAFGDSDGVIRRGELGD